MRVTEPVIDVDYVTTEEEDAYDAACVDAAYAAPDAGQTVSFDDVLAELGLTREELGLRPAPRSDAA